MTLDEAILHAKQKADENEKSAKYMKEKYGDHVIGYSIHCKCAEEHRQLAEWLKELRERRKAEEGEYWREVVTCGKCKYGKYTGTECFCDKHSGHADRFGEDSSYHEYHSKQWYCADGEKREEEGK